MRWLALVPALFAALVGLHAASAVTPAAQLVASSRGKIVLLSPSGRLLRTVVARGESPACSHDGRIAFVRDGDVWVVGVDGHALRRVTRTTAIEEHPDWSPDGTLVYASNRGGRFELWTQRPGAAARPLTQPPKPWQEDRAPQWSPDGRWVAFASNRPSAFNGELYLVRRDGRRMRRLTFTPGSDNLLGDDGMPTWRPDGAGLVFSSNRDRNWELYGFDLRMRTAKRLTSTPSVDESLPQIASDGSFAMVVQPRGRGSPRVAVASADLRERTTLRPGTAVDWRPD